MIRNRPYATPPIYVPLHSQQKDDLHSSWMNYFESINQQLNQSLTKHGNVMPAITDAEAAQVASISNQKVIYNDTLNAYQGNINGIWETFTTLMILSESDISDFQGTHSDRVQLIYDKTNDEVYVIKGNIKFKLKKA